MKYDISDKKLDELLCDEKVIDRIWNDLDLNLRPPLVKTGQGDYIKIDHSNSLLVCFASGLGSLAKFFKKITERNSNHV